MKREIKRCYNATKIKVNELVLEDEDIPETWKKVFYKTYPRFTQIKLSYGNIGEGLAETLKARKSSRNFSRKALKYAELSNILYWSAGKKEEDEGN